MNDDMIDQAFADLSELRTRFPDLREALTPGTPRRWTYQEMSPGQKHRLNVQARADRDARDTNTVRGIVASGHSAAPIRTEVLDAQAAIEHGVYTLDGEIAERLDLTPQWGDVTETITRIIKRLWRVDPIDELAAHVRNEARRLNRIAGRALGESEPVVPIDARCPHCDAKSLRAFPDRDVVLCTNGSCQCGDGDCRCHRERAHHHEWNYTEWPGLAAELGAA